MLAYILYTKIIYLLISEKYAFVGTKVEAEVHGKRELKLLSVGETYLMNSPNLVIRFFPVQGVDWVGNVTIRCQETGLVAELCYKGSIIGRSNHRKIRGKIFMSTSSKSIYEISGHWDRYFGTAMYLFTCQIWVLFALYSFIFFVSVNDDYFF